MHPSVSHLLTHCRCGDTSPHSTPDPQGYPLTVPSSPLGTEEDFTFISLPLPDKGNLCAILGSVSLDGTWMGCGAFWRDLSQLHHCSTPVHPATPPCPRNCFLSSPTDSSSPPPQKRTKQQNKQTKTSLLAKLSASRTRSGVFSVEQGPDHRGGCFLICKPVHVAYQPSCVQCPSPMGGALGRAFHSVMAMHGMPPLWGRGEAALP